jgi:hypothetical protein
MHDSDIYWKAVVNEKGKSGEWQLSWVDVFPTLGPTHIPVLASYGSQLPVSSKMATKYYSIALCKPLKFLKDLKDLSSPSSLPVQMRKPSPEGGVTCTMSKQESGLQHSHNS